ncbi:hypothetical protein J0X19_21070 [Hymenobacter sp. BT186]|uniref:Uncharacterized protein n=1 Tax=Hymenobacter telluris TaxID=2816474 RepID=A0A939F0E7_9BACT|nr:hypothetical protein [Hymenobacter telluris]MBO0360467.1 hypothetical protein [Hymenobacter telluris]MBW3376494.1 hypothetical protein [Hymenobacter norwichensis]
MTRRLLVGFKDLFDSSTPPTLASLLSGVSRFWLLRCVTQLLGYQNQVPAAERTLKMDMERIFGERGLVEKPFAKRAYAHITSFGQQFGKDALNLLHPKPLLQLFEYGFERPDEPHTLSDEELEASLFLACLFVNTPYIDQQSAASTAAEKLLPTPTVPRFALTSMFSDFELINQQPVQVLWAQLIKSTRFFEFLESESRFKPLLQAFLAHYDCATWQDYTRQIAGLVKPVIYADQPGRISVVVAPDAEFEASRAFLAHFALTPGQELDREDFTSLRETPLYEEEPGCFVLIYPVLVVEMLHKGLYFQFNKLNKALPAAEQVSDWRSVYCDFFSEQYLLNALLDASFQGRGLALSGTVIKESKTLKGQGEPDYYFRNGQRAVLFESKDVLVPKDAKAGTDFTAYFEAVRKRFDYETDKKGKRVDKAVRQLLRNVVRLLEKQFPLDTDYDKAELIIYPVLVLHDRLYNVPGLNVLVNDWFQQQMALLAEKGLVVRNVRPVVMVDVDTVLAFHEHFRDQQLVFEDVLEEYFGYLHPDLSRAKSDAEVEKLIMQQAHPFALFLENYAGERGMSPLPKQSLYGLLPIINKGAPEE